MLYSFSLSLLFSLTRFAGSDFFGNTRLCRLSNSEGDHRNKQHSQDAQHAKKTKALKRGSQIVINY